MNPTILWRFLYRANLWLKWLPVYVLLMEIVVPIKLTVLPFLLLMNVFVEFNSMVPCTMKSIQMTKYKLVDCVRSNNTLLGILGTLSNLVVGAVVILFSIVTNRKFDLSPLYSFIPLLVASILFGNLSIYLDFANFRAHGILRFVAYAVLLFVVSLVTSYSTAAYVSTALFLIAGLLISYKLLNAHD